MSKIIYIAGLGHSGSTILDMSLGTNRGVVGLGELKTLLDDQTRERHYSSVCSCGQKAGQCRVWGELKDLLKEEGSLEEKYNLVVGLLQKLYGPDVTLVDSSKNSYSYLKSLNRKYDLRVIYLTRDIRSWSFSRHLSTGKPVVYFFFRWLLENFKLISQLRKMNIDPMKVGYEELALYPGHVLSRISSFAGIPFSEQMLAPGKTNSHIISGNVVRADDLKKAAWTYDARWMVSGRMLLLTPLLLPIMRINRKLVFPNTARRSLKDFHLFGTRRKERMDQKYN